MKKNFLILNLFLGMVLFSTLSHALCANNASGRWNCFPKGDTSKVSTGDCKNMNCPDGCVEAPDGTHGHCCPEITETNCRTGVLSDGCVKRKKIDCQPNQRCDENGVCQDL